jgi:hypothetical protein
MEHRLVERCTQRLGAGEGPEERDLRVGHERQRRQASGCAHVAEQREHVGLDELVGVGLAAIGLVAVVEGAQLDSLAVDAAGRVDAVEVDARAAVHLDAELRGRAREGGRLAEHEALRLREGGQGECASGCAEPRDGVTTIHDGLPLGGSDCVRHAASFGRARVGARAQCALAIVNKSQPAAATRQKVGAAGLVSATSSA